MTWQSLREARRYLALALMVELLVAPLGRARGRLLAAVSLICLFFFRDPERELDPDDDVVYAPADGTIVGIDTTPEKWLGNQEALRVSTFLALYDVHVNRSPAAGEIVEAESIEGGYAPAFLRRAQGNHRKRLAIDNGDRRVVVVQTAGMVARRISSWAWLGDRVSPGERIAVIHFGSRAEVLVPAHEAEPLTHVGQRVQAGVTPIVRYTRGKVEA
jgi:phosphatidylserine decarboxylase